MSSLNQAQLIGRLGKDPETRFTGSGKAVTNFSIATDETWKNAAGEKQSKTTWHRCVAWGKLAEIIQTYVKKGNQIFVQGRIENREWEKDGVKRWSTEIVVDKMQMLGSKNDGASRQPDAPAHDDFDAPGGERVSQPQQAQAAQPDISDEDMPF